ncbi:HK97 gp10 family phage protein [Novosphingobium pentaromativorans]|nr:HK97 gp10 family phage protein [Novosphingobium pentaromativorans]
MPVKRTGNIAIKIQKLTPEIEAALRPVVYAIADEVKTDAQISLSTGAVSGAGHVPSAPGTPPNSDTGHLADSIEVEEMGPLRARVVAKAEYAAIQELGGTINHPGGTPYFMKDGKPVFVSNSGYGAFHHLPKTKPHTITLPERPFMRPAGIKNQKSGKALMKAAVARVLKTGKL